MVLTRTLETAFTVQLWTIFGLGVLGMLMALPAVSAQLSRREGWVHVIVNLSGTQTHPYAWRYQQYQRNLVGEREGCMSRSLGVKSAPLVGIAALGAECSFPLVFSAYFD